MVRIDRRELLELAKFAYQTKIDEINDELRAEDAAARKDQALLQLGMVYEQASKEFKIPVAKAKRGPGGKRKLSAEGRARIAAAQTARWQKVRREAKKLKKTEAA